MYTLNDLTNDVNIALNYPAINFQDIKLYLNQAISELNSSLHISIRNVNDIIAENYANVSQLKNLIELGSAPTEEDVIPSLAEDPTVDEDNTIFVYFNTTMSKFRVYNQDKLNWDIYDELYASYVDGVVKYVYKATLLNNDFYWVAEVYNNPLELDLSKYICNDWIILFIIPYICFKFSARDNDTGAIFSEEFTQGFQQLLIAYRIPDKVNLAKVAGLLPYTEDVKKALPLLNIMCPTRAITEDMKIPKDIQATFGGFNDRGGWGI